MQAVQTRGRGGDTLIRGGQVADGTGAPLRRADILTAGERIRAVEPAGAIRDEGGYQVVDAAGLVVAPGFVDVHSHADNAPLLAEDDTTKLLQGVTTEVVGNCGFSLAPVPPDRAEELARLSGRIFPPMEWTWRDFPSWLETLDARGYPTNYVPLVGHGTLRLAVAGFDNRPLRPDELERMRGLLAEALAAGAFGFSSGLIYPPGVFAGTGELAALAEALPPERVYATHMRDEGVGLLDSIQEAVEVARCGGCRLQVSHLKAAGEPAWGRTRDALDVLDQARADGVSATHDVYPYTASSTMLSAVLPSWAQEGGDEAVLARLADPDTLARIEAEIAGGGTDTWVGHLTAAYERIRIASTASHAYEGSTVAEIAEANGTSGFEALVGVLRAEQLRVSMIAFVMDEQDLTTVLSSPWTMIGSDGLPPGVGGRPHPRLTGTFPRVLGRYVRDRGVLELTEAVRRMTALPAATFGLADRGVVRAGAVADLVAFDPDRITDTGGYDDPLRPPAGLAWVRQAGGLVVEGNRWLGTRRGRRLTPA